MYVRLAFAVAAHLEPEILVVDEVLAVGDAEFQKKCIGKMQDVGRQGRTILFVSHNMNAVAKLTSKAVLIDSGRVAAFDSTQEVIRQYLAVDGTLTPEWTRRRDSAGDRDVVLTAVRCINPAGQVTGRFHSDMGFAVEIEFLVRKKHDVQIAFRLNSESDSTTVFTSALPDHRNEYASRFEPGRYRSRCYIPAHLLVPGTYYLLVAANNPKGPQFDLLEQVLNFEVTPMNSLTSLDARLGIVAPLLAWDLVSKDQAC
jgi:lipopolysaccharide transport system ATP-binding protein